VSLLKTIFLNREGEIECGSPGGDNSTSQSLFEIQMVAKFLGSEVAHALTSLDLSGNNLSLLVGLAGLNNLRKLNLSHNKLSTLSNLQKLPNLIEFRMGHNCLRFFQSTALILNQATPRLMSLDILPNLFQVNFVCERGCWGFIYNFPA
jgi:hypothetical protein